MRAASARWPALRPAVVVALGAALLAGLSATSFGARLERALARETAPATALGSEKLRRALIRDERLSLVPPTPEDDCTGAALSTRRLAPDPMPSSLTVPAAWRGSPALLSLWIDPCRRERLEAHPLEHGRAWEEIGWVSFYERGELRFASPAGVRIHGGESRSRRPPSLRLYFRASLGSTPLPAEILSPELHGEIASLIADANAGSSNDGMRWQFLDAITFDVARRLGADAPFARPVRVAINGEAPAVYQLLERIDADSFALRHGHREVDIVRGKFELAADERPERAALLASIEALPRPLGPAAAEASFDLDSLVDGFVGSLYCATGDLFQAALVRDRRGELALGRWRFVPWDLDQSFRDPKGFSRFRKEKDVLAWTLHHENHDLFPAGRLLRRLLDESPAFRLRVAQRATDALNHELTPRFAAELVARYRGVANELAIDDTRFLDALEVHLARRPGEIHAQLERFLDVGPALAVAVDAPAGTVRVDGFEVGAPYAGLYPRGTRLRIEVEKASLPFLLGFRVGGVTTLAPSGVLEREVLEPTTIEPLFAPSGSAYGSRSTG